ncbi:insulinase family protein [Actinoplanes sp. NPDC051494]|uniref:insulinase family protein n=1 Tax=Actinoplanes sp. NPDC051494 TaxID=3363907 RepID=UPI0037A436DB
MIEQLVVDGVPALLAPTTGPMHAGLAFRVGAADEPLARRGITHLIEHLALPGGGYHQRGTTGARYTYFHRSGPEAEVVAFVNGVCAALGDLPMDRLDREKDILRAESAGVGDPLTIRRYGARDHGTPGFPEFGLDGCTEEVLRAWAAEYFTARNAVLWVAADHLPEGLRIALPPGRRRPLPIPSAVPMTRPAYFTGPDGTVAWNAVVPRSAAALVCAGVLDRALLHSLHEESGLSCVADTAYEPLGDGTTMITASAEAPPRDQAAVLGALVDVLSDLRVGRIDPADLGAVVEQGVAALERAESRAARLPGQAFAVLTGRPVQPVEEAVAELRAVTRADVTAVAVAAWHDGLLMTPRGTHGDRAGFTAAPRSSVPAVTGTGYGSLTDDRARLVAGPEGVSLVAANGDSATVRFAACEVVLAWPDGARRLIGSDALSVSFDPASYAGADAVVALVDASVPAARRVGMPAREPAATPPAAAGEEPGSSWFQVMIRRLAGLVPGGKTSEPDHGER